jgi:hypothetical protein
MTAEDMPRLSPTGWQPSEKFWLSPEGRVIPLSGLWHYQWALRHRADHHVDLGDETEEQPIRLRMLAAGWWRLNFDRKTCGLTVEGDSAWLNEGVRRAVNEFIRVNAGTLNRVRIHLLDDQVLVDSLLIEPVSKEW